ncbi:MAG: hypothetical protein WAW88_14180 [Nocardioides sp.]
MPPLARLSRLVLGAATLGLGIALMLESDLGADGYSTFINGISLTTGMPFAVTNVVIGAVLLAFSWWRGVTLGTGTLLQPVVVGVTVSAARGLLREPLDALPHALVFFVGMLVVSLGVALYLSAELGPGPAEGPALAMDPPVPFRFGYSALQIGQAIIGWLLGSTIGWGTVLTVVLIGPIVDLFGRLVGPRRKV